MNKCATRPRRCTTPRTNKFGWQGDDAAAIRKRLPPCSRLDKHGGAAAFQFGFFPLKESKSKSTPMTANAAAA